MMPGLGGNGMERALAALREHWGHDTFRPGQEPVLRDVLDGRDVLGVLPTGAGKSVCYQVPALLSDGLTLVVSPLVALMADQVAGLRRRGVPATWLGSALSYGESERRWDDLLAGRYRLLYVAPERLGTERFRARSERLDVTRIAVDEAHCVSEWGHDFRPDYLRIVEARERLGDPPVIAVTATATPPVRRDIVRLLGLRNAAVHVHGFDRPNIVWSVFEDPDKPGRVGDVLDGVPGGGIVYAGTRSGVDAWAGRLAREGHEATGYHAGMDPELRRTSQEAWVSGRTRIMVATSAFGMGIDRPDVRFVVHVDPPPSLEAYYQEAGRAGRDGRPAHAVLLLDSRDEAARADRIAAEHPDAGSIVRVFETACSLAGIAVGSRTEQPFPLDERRIAETAGLPVGAVRRAVELLEREGCWSRVRLRPGEGLVRMRTAADALRRFAAEHPGSATLVDGLLRVVPPDAWNVPRPIDPSAITGSPDPGAGLAYLAERSMLDWQPPDRAALFALPGARPARVSVDAGAARRSRRRAEQRFADLVAYARAVGCRRTFLLAYFGESAPDRCGRCDACTGRHEAYVAVPGDQVALTAVLEAVSSGIRPDRASGLDGIPAWKRRAMAAWLVDAGYLQPTGDTGTPYELTASGRETLARFRQGARSAFS